MKHLFKEVAEELNIPVDIVEKVVRSQFSFIRDIFSEHTFKSVRLPFFGIFRVKKYRLNMLEGRWKIKFTEEQFENSYEQNKYKKLREDRKQKEN